MGQFYKLKYFAGDLKQEIHYPIQEAREDVWKQNLSLTRLGLMAKEVDDFLPHNPHGRASALYLLILLSGQPEGLPFGRIR